MQKVWPTCPPPEHPPEEPPSVTGPEPRGRLRRRDVGPARRQPRRSPGRIVALLGANGAGKTTLLRALSGLLDVHDGAVTKGAVTLDDRPIHRLRPSAIVRR